MAEPAPFSETSLPLCATPPRDVLGEFLADHVLQDIEATPQYQTYRDLYRDEGASATLQRLESDAHIRAVTIDYARIKASHSIGSDPNKWIIGVRFVGADDDLKNFVLSTVEQWQEALDDKIVFREHDSAGSLTVKFTGSDSYHHKTRTLSIPTARLYAYQGQTNWNAATNMVLHEFGHALGFEHEHFSESCKAYFDFESAIDIAETIDGWDEDRVKSQITEGKAVNVCGTQQGCDTDSVMIYPVDKSWSKNKRSAIRNPKLSKHDVECVRILYGLE